MPVSLLGWLLAPQILQLMTADAAVAAVGSEYFRWRVLAVAAVGMSFAFRGYWNGSHNAWHYLRILLLVHAGNVALSYGLIHGLYGLPQLGAPGAGLGASVALFSGAALNALSLRSTPGFLRRSQAGDLSRLITLSLPHSLQQLLFATGITLLFWIIARIGTAELAVAHVLVNITLLLILPAIGLGMVATTLVSRSLGSGDVRTAWRWGWEVSGVAAVVLVLAGIPFWLFPEAILGAFVRDPALIELGRLPLCLTGAGMVLDAVGLVLAQALLGAGASRTVMLITLGNQ